MKTIKLLTLSLILIGFSACSSDDDGNGPQEFEFETVTNLYAPQESDYTTNPPTFSGDFIKFSFATGTTVTGDNWDIALRGNYLLVNGGEATENDQPERTGNGGAYIATGTLESVTINATSDDFNQDSMTTGLAIPKISDMGWYHYTGEPNHAIVPIAGKILVFRTHDGKYAKMEITSYYKDSPEDPDSNIHEEQYYTFNYVYLAN